MNSHFRNIRVFVGYDPREAIAYHVFCQSLIEHSSSPLTITPLALKHLATKYSECHKDGSNQFIYSRFLVPFLSGFQGISLFFDGDMVIETDVHEILDHLDPSNAVHVVKHDYQTKHPIKYFGNKNENYPRKNWSSVIVFNNEHPSNKILQPDFVSIQSGSYLHRFSWLADHEIGEIPMKFNWLVNEYPKSDLAELLHYTLGIPCLKGFNQCDSADRWFHYFNLLNQGVQLRDADD